MTANHQHWLTKAANTMTAARTVLVVDADHVSAIYVAAVLENDGYTVQLARVAAEGLALLAQHPVGVVITDYRIPDMDGGTFLEQVRRDYPPIVRIMLSSVDSLDASINQSVIYRFLIKPVSTNTLRTTVHQAFQFGKTGLYSHSSS